MKRLSNLSNLPMLFAMLFAVMLLTVAVRANDDDAAADPAEDAPAASADRVLEELLEEGRPTIEPTRRPSPTRSGQPREAIQLDPEVLGVAPGGERPALRPEGQFIINRRARMVQSADGNRSVLVFEADSAEAAEPPMILLPCRILEDMETLVEERGDQLIFIISGQITAYRGVNHLLPTMMREAADPANLRR
jgi:hypothetical protein